MSTGALAAFAGYGIELEYAIVDRDSLDVRPLTAPLLREAAGGEATEVERGAMGWSNELVGHVVEIKNRHPHHSLDGLPAAFHDELRAIDARLERHGARLMPSGMHPWMDPRHETQLWDGPHAELYRHYHRLFDCRRHGWANLQSMHVNLPFADGEEFARLHAAVRLVLPILPALAASSPFVEGRPSGFMDYRLEVYRGHQARIPASMGAIVPEPCASPADYQAEVLTPMYRELDHYDDSGLLRHEWFNARGAIARFDRSAIEIRLLDTQECPQADLAIAAAVIALVRRLYDAPPREALPTAALVQVLDACIRDADEAAIDDEVYLAALGCPLRASRAGELWSRLVDALLDAGTLAAEWSPALAVIFARGPLARRLRHAVGRKVSRAALQAVYRDLCDCLHRGEMFPG